MSKQPDSSMPSTRIRPLGASDLGAVVNLSLLAWAPVSVPFEAILGNAILDQIYHPDPRTAQAVSVRETCSADDVEAFVALRADDVVAGFVALRHDAAATTGKIDMIAVHPQHQRQGHARALMAFAIQRFRDQGLPLVNVGIGGDLGQAPARALYEAVGFTGLPLVNSYMVVETSQG